MTDRFVAYYRVSTLRQGQSGLGLEAQQAMVATMGQAIAEFVEIESGKDDANRPQLQRALAHCRLTRATLVIAKLDRLSRDAAFLLGLAKAGVKVVCADNPTMDETMFGMLAVFAQHERKAISTRTREALQAAKARGVKLGKPENMDASAFEAGRAKGSEMNKANAAARSVRYVEIIRDIQSQGLTSLRQIADELNARGIPTARGGQWQATSVMRLLPTIG